MGRGLNKAAVKAEMLQEIFLVKQSIDAAVGKCTESQANRTVTPTMAVKEVRSSSCSGGQGDA